MTQLSVESITERIIYPQLPLAVYREVAAHLRQVPGVRTQLVASDSDRFDYAESQVGYLVLTVPATLSQCDRDRLEEILSFYSDRYGQSDRRPLAD